MTTATSPKQSVNTLLLDVTNTTLTVTPEQFDLLCINNPDLRLELTPNRELIVMAPAGGESSKRGHAWFCIEHEQNLVIVRVSGFIN